MKPSPQERTRARILTINGGSSSIRFALFEVRHSLERTLQGKIERIGLPRPLFTVKGIHPGETFSHTVAAADHREAAQRLVEWIEQHAGTATLAAIGHRIVHGGPKYAEAQRITEAMLDELRELSAFDPEHLPEEILLAEAFQQRFPALPQVACFDTAFHRDLPRRAKLLPIPLRYEARGVRRYGFHGLSYAYLMRELARVADARAANGRVILAHLGNGASLAAVRDGRPVDTSMGFTPAAGVPMSTRSGDLDPGLAWYLKRTEGLDARAFNELVNTRSGLLGLSETSSDMRDLLEREADDPRAADAVGLFCYQVRKWIGAFAAALGGLDTLVFSGGIGENGPRIRARVCEDLGFLGVDLDPGLNEAGAPLISSPSARVAVRVMRTDEEWMIAHTVCGVLESLPEASPDPDVRNASAEEKEPSHEHRSESA